MNTHTCNYRYNILSTVLRATGPHERCSDSGGTARDQVLFGFLLPLGHLHRDTVYLRAHHKILALLLLAGTLQ